MQEPDIEVLRDLWLARFGYENVRLPQLYEIFWYDVKNQLRDADKLLVFVNDARSPVMYRLREKDNG